MKKSFYRFALSFRDAKNNEEALFAEAMFNDLSFPKEEKEYDALSRYVEESGEVHLKSIIFDELYDLYVERILNK